MFGFIRDLLLQWFFRGLYTKYKHRGWPLMSHAPSLLNVALPDFSVVYMMASFDPEDDVQIVGTPPKNCVYYSLYVYDDKGLPVLGYRDKDIPVMANGKYRIRFRRPCKSTYCVIYRVYTTDNKAPPAPMLAVNEKDIPIEEPSVVREESKSASPSIVSLLSRRPIQIPRRFTQFTRPQQKMTGLFPNPDSHYMVAFPKPGHVMKIRGRLPPKIGREHDLRFVGFMASDVRTTSTYDSVSSRNLPSSYTIWVACNKDEAVATGWKKGVGTLLLFPHESDMNVVVYRKVIVGLVHEDDPYFPTIDYVNVHESKLRSRRESKKKLKSREIQRGLSRRHRFTQNDF